MAQYDGGDGEPNAPSSVPGYTNAQLKAALEASLAANPASAGLGPSPNVDYGYGTQAAPTATPPPDWSSYLGMYGLPTDVQKELNTIFSRTPDVQQAISLALAYVRGTDWYRVTYPGIQDAMAKGIVRNEADYRARQNDFNQIYRQYNGGRDMTAAEFAGYLGEGVTLDTVSKRFQGAAYASVYGNDWQYLSGNFGEGRLSDAEKTAAGRQQAGLDSELGMRIQRRLQQAQERIRTVFSGTLATSKITQPLGEQSGSLPDVGR